MESLLEPSSHPAVHPPADLEPSQGPARPAGPVPIAPPERLAEHVERFVVFDGLPSFHSVLPNGAADLVVGLRLEDPSGARIPFPSHLLHTHLQAPFLAFPFTRFWAVTVQFKPGGLAALLDRPMADLVGGFLPVADDPALGWAARLDGEDPWRLVESVRDALAEKLDAAEPRSEMETSFRRLVVRDAEASPGRLRRLLGVESRPLQRLARRIFGLDLRSLHGVRRLGRAVERARAARPEGAPRWTWADVAADAGYSDQAHLIRQCRRITRRTPSRLLEEIDAGLALDRWPSREADDAVWQDGAGAV